MYKSETELFKNFLIVFTSVVLSAFAILIDYTLTYALENSTGVSTSTSITHHGVIDEETMLEQFSKFINGKFDDTISTLELVSQTNLFKNFDSTANISEVLHGVPNDVEKYKRELLSQILKENDDIASIFLILPNGNIYLGEPFADQKQLPRLNFADREWYIGANLRNSSYVSTVFSSAAINAPAIAVAIPIMNWQADGPSVQYKDGLSRTVGYIVAIMDFKSTKELLFKFLGETNDSFHVVDKNGTELIDSSNKTYNTNLKSFNYLGIVKSDSNLKEMTSYKLNKGNESKLLHLMPMAITGNTWYVIMVSPA